MLVFRAPWLTSGDDVMTTRNARDKEHIKKKFNHCCAECGGGGRLEIHHILPLGRGGTNAYANLVPLCGECHAKHHPELDRW